MSAERTFVIVGASLAGAQAAEALRREGFEGRVVLVGEEAERPYERPPLSKDFLRGGTGRDKVYVHDEGFYADQDIELRTSTRAVATMASRWTSGWRPASRASSLPATWPPSGTSSKEPASGSSTGPTR